MNIPTQWKDSKGGHMKYVDLGNTGAKVSELCLGSMMLGTATDKKTAFQILDHFTEEMGGNFIDTANSYAWWIGDGENIGDESENLLGQWMKERNNRNKIFLASKVGGRLRNPYTIRNFKGEIAENVPSYYQGLSKAVIMQEIENSLHRLKTDYLDLYYSHVYDDNTPIEETLDALDTLVKEGKIRLVGASNISKNLLANANQVSQQKGLAKYSVLQSEYSYLHPTKGTNADSRVHVGKDIFDYVASENMTFCAYSPLLKGIYSNRDNCNRYHDWHLFNSEKNLKKLDFIEKYSKQLNISGNQLVLAWMLHKNPRIIPIFGFSKMDQYLENVKSCEITIPEEILQALNEAE